MGYSKVCFFFFFFNDTATTEIYTLSLHDALPISPAPVCVGPLSYAGHDMIRTDIDRKSTRLNSSHLVISYAVFCLKKKRNIRLSIRSYTSNIFYTLLRISVCPTA